MSQPVSFATSWQPTLKGNTLGPCHLIADLVEDDICPETWSSSELPWTPSRMKAELLLAGVAKAAIVESVLAIWRLQRHEERGANDPEWQNHLEAWLVRHDFEIESFDVLTSALRFVTGTFVSRWGCQLSGSSRASWKRSEQWSSYQ